MSLGQTSERLYAAGNYSECLETLKRFSSSSAGLTARVSDFSLSLTVCLLSLASLSRFSSFALILMPLQLTAMSVLWLWPQTLLDCSSVSVLSQLGSCQLPTADWAPRWSGVTLSLWRAVLATASPRLSSSVSPSDCRFAMGSLDWPVCQLDSVRRALDFRMNSTSHWQDRLAAPQCLLRARPSSLELILAPVSFLICLSFDCRSTPTARWSSIR